MSTHLTYAILPCPMYVYIERSEQMLPVERQEGAGSVEIHRLLEPVYASGTLQTLSLPRGEVYFHQIILFILCVTAIGLIR